MVRRYHRACLKVALPLILALILCFLEIPSAYAVSLEAPESVEAQAASLQYEGYGYNYSMLTAEKNGEAMQRLYRDIDTVAKKYLTGGGNVPTDDPYSADSGNVYYELPGASFKGSDYSLSVEEMISVYFTYRADFPEAFFLPPSYLYSGSSQTVFLAISKDHVLESVRTKYYSAASKRLEEFKNSLPAGISDYEIAVAAHDLIVKENFYRYDSGSIPSTAASAHSITGWLDGTGVVCEGYAKAYQFLLSGAGVDCSYVTGTANGTAHAWNIVKCDGQWFWVDLTFDDQSALPGGFYRYYFGLPNSAFLLDHTPGTTTYGSAYQVPLPKISDGFEMFYYQKAGATVTSDSTASLKSLTQHAQKAFDRGDYSIALFADSPESKKAFTNILNAQSGVTLAIKNAGLALRCDNSYAYSTVSSADAGVGGCLIFIKFDYHSCDVDHNTYVEKSDAEFILNALCDNVPMKDEYDTDKNGSISIYDAVLVFKAMK